MYVKDIQEYYSDIKVLWEMTKLIGDVNGKRETAFYSKTLPDTDPRYGVRYINITKPDDFKFNFARRDFFNRNYNLYRSMYKVKTMPLFASNPMQRRTQITEFQQSFNDLLCGYDFYIDIDAEDINIAYSIAKKVKNYMDSKQYSYAVIYSGAKGFHFIVPFEHTNLHNVNVTLIPKMVYATVKQIARELNINITDAHTQSGIDTGVYSIKSVLRIPYSIHMKTLHLCYPLSDEEFYNFEPDKYHYTNIDTDNLLDRGLCVRINENKLDLLK
jgi:hypothetical protein